METIFKRRAAKMDAYEDETLSFILRIWLEQAAGETDQLLWRGHITHVPSGDRRHVQSKEALFEFIDSYLAKMRTRSDI